MPTTNFPRQLLTDKEKDKKWCEQNLDAMAPYIAQHNNSLYIPKQHLITDSWFCGIIL